VDSWFLPPVITRTAPVERTPEVSSVRYRGLFLTYWAGQSVEVAGTTYQGGRWHGPLSAQQIADITAAGYAERIVEADDAATLPVLDP
jgi:hypothetical protein